MLTLVRAMEARSMVPSADLRDTSVEALTFKAWCGEMWRNEGDMRRYGGGLFHVSLRSPDVS